jgi:hypothetical protein
MGVRLHLVFIFVLSASSIRDTQQQESFAEVFPDNVDREPWGWNLDRGPNRRKPVGARHIHPFMTFYLA